MQDPTLEEEEEELLRGIEFVVLVDGYRDVPGATESLGDDYEIASAELDELRGAFGVGFHLSFE